MEVLKKGVETTMDGLKNGMEEKIEGLQEDMEFLKEGLSNLIQEMIPNGEKIVDENNDEKKINLNHDFINSNFGLRTTIFQRWI